MYIYWINLIPQLSLYVQLDSANEEKEKSNKKSLLVSISFPPISHSIMQGLAFLRERERASIKNKNRWFKWTFGLFWRTRRYGGLNPGKKSPCHVMRLEGETRKDVQFLHPLSPSNVKFERIMGFWAIYLLVRLAR